MKGRFAWTTLEGGSVAQLSGDIDENADLAGFAARMAGQSVTLDVGQVRRINSLGMRAWVQMMQQLRSRATVLQRCSPAVVEQLNMLRDFRGSAVIESVLLPYACEACDETQLVEFKLAGFRRTDPLPPGPACKRCGQAMSFDDIPERYFNFIA